MLNLIYPAIIFLLLIAAFFTNKIKTLNNLQLTALSVGHGQAVIVQMPDSQNIIIDAGSMTRGNIGSKIVNPFLDYIAADKLYCVFISHSDIDHYNGLPEILKEHKCKNVYTTLQFIQNAASSKTDAVLVDFIKSLNLHIDTPSQKVYIGKVNITRLWPQELSVEEPMSDNEASLVLLIEYAGRKILVCSDITKKIQSELINLYPAMDIDIMITPHHGSGRTLEPIFLNAFKPEIFITSCCEARFESISEKIKEFEQSFLTCRDGSINVVINSNGKIRIRKYR
jgi:competence protein ComEC